MDQLQGQQSNNHLLPHIVQVYQQPASEVAKLQNTHIIHITHSSMQTSQPGPYPQAPVPYHETHSPQVHHHQRVDVQTQSHVIQPHPEIQTGCMQPLQVTQQLMVPVQHMVVNRGTHSHHYYEQCGYSKQLVNAEITKLKPETKCKVELAVNSDCVIPANSLPIKSEKKNRRNFPDPSKWACNVRKTKHQKGEAYINRRGKYVPERKVINTKDCLKSCKYKCNEHINDTDRGHIFKAFYSLSANEKKHYLLNTTERHLIKRLQMSMGDDDLKRKYSFKYFFLVRAVRYTVCKNFYLGTLAISQKPVYNVHMGKSEMNIPKPDGRGLSEGSTQGLSTELKDIVRKHIMSFQTMDLKPIVPFVKKRQYLVDPNLSVKQMYKMYQSYCNRENKVFVKESMYRKILKSEFNIHFKKIKVEPQVLCAKCKEPVNKK